jgi:hypothetical protein
MGALGVCPEHQPGDDKREICGLDLIRGGWTTNEHVGPHLQYMDNREIGQYIRGELLTRMYE